MFASRGRTLRRAAGVAAATLAYLAAGSSPAHAATPLALTEPAAQLDRALECDGGARGDRAVVILVHGTGSSPEESFSFGYARALPRLGFGVCTVRLPDSGAPYSRGSCGRARGSAPPSARRRSQRARRSPRWPRSSTSWWLRHRPPRGWTARRTS